jgi:hypothetical protein
MCLAHVFSTVCFNDNPSHVVWNRNDFQLSRMPIGFCPQFFHYPDEFLVIPWNKRTAPIQTRLLWRRRMGPIGSSIDLLQRFRLPKLT